MQALHSGLYLVIKKAVHSQQKFGLLLESDTVKQLFCYLPNGPAKGPTAPYLVLVSQSQVFKQPLREQCVLCQHEGKGQPEVYEQTSQLLRVSLRSITSTQQAL